MQTGIYIPALKKGRGFTTLVSFGINKGVRKKHYVFKVYNGFMQGSLQDKRRVPVIDGSSLELNCITITVLAWIGRPGNGIKEVHL